MSGDVQPRKRKDKRRKKDEAPGQEEPVVQFSAPTGNEDFNIHVHNDHGTGGGICAKLVFFALLSIIAVLIGMIFIEKRGLTDLDTVPTESRFAQIFDGWIDESFNDHEHEEDDVAHGAIEDHDDHEHEESEEHTADDDDDDHHDEEEDDVHDDEDEYDDHKDDEEVEKTQVSEEQQVSAEEEEQRVSAENDQDNEGDENEHDEDAAEDETNEEKEEQEEEASEEQEVEASEEQEVEASEEQQLSTEDNQDDQEDDDDQDDDDEIQQVSEENTEDNEDDTTNEIQDYNEDNASEQVDLENDDIEEDNDNEDVSKENEVIEEDSTVDGQDEEEVVDNTAGEEDALKEEAEKQEADEGENTSMAVKLGVGVALVFVAHIVLVRKWRSGQTSAEKAAQEEIVSDLSRRNTIVAPAPLAQIENELENVEDEYSEEEEEEEELEESEEEIIIEPVKTKSTYQQLQSTYSKSLPPETVSSKSDEKKIPSYYYEDDNQGEEYEEVEDEEEIEEGDDQDEGEEIEEVESGVADEDISDVDDDELLKKLEAKYGKLPNSKNNKADEKEAELEERFSAWKKVKVLPDSAEESEGSDDGHWVKKDPNLVDKKIKLGESHLQHQNTELALNIFTNLMENMPTNLRVKHGRAKALDQLAEKKRSNELLQDAISSYIDLLQSSDIDDELFVEVADRCIDRIRFRGHYNKAIQVHKRIIDRFPDIPKHRNQLAVTLLTANRLAEAKRVLHEVLQRWPDNGFAQVHYGFILKTKENNLDNAIKFLQSGIDTREPGVLDGRFYFHLGDALTRLGRKEEALQVYEDGVKQNVFLSKYQRSLYNVDRLSARPWWPLNKTPYSWFFQLLEKNWKTIRDEGLSLLSKSGYFRDETENLKDTGEWKQFELFSRGQKIVGNCKQSPETCRLVENLPDAKGCRRGQIKFSVMHPGTHVWPHCGPSNCRLRAHLGLKVPQNTFIRVAEEIRSWREGKVFLFDDSFEHEVWHNGTEFRLILIVDVWHPELTAHEKRTLPAI